MHIFKAKRKKKNILVKPNKVTSLHIKNSDQAKAQAFWLSHQNKQNRPSQLDQKVML